MRPENARMSNWLAAHGLPGVRVKRIMGGSLGGRWRLHRPGEPWTPAVAKVLTDLGFRDFDGREFGLFSGNGGLFQVFATGHNEIGGAS